MEREGFHTGGGSSTLQTWVASLLFGREGFASPLPKIHQSMPICKIALLPNHTAYKQHFGEKIQLLCKLTFHPIKLPRTASNGGATCLLWYSAVQLACYG